jgi:hypothetical protein
MPAETFNRGGPSAGNGKVASRADARRARDLSVCRGIVIVTCWRVGSRSRETPRSKPIGANIGELGIARCRGVRARTASHERRAEPRAGPSCDERHRSRMAPSTRQRTSWNRGPALCPRGITRPYMAAGSGPNGSSHFDQARPKFSIAPDAFGAHAEGRNAKP